MELGKQIEKLDRFKFNSDIINPLYNVVFTKEISREVTLPAIISFNKTVRTFGNIRRKMINTIIWN